jgi:predicted nuclease with RNAse H fold
MQRERSAGIAQPVQVSAARARVRRCWAGVDVGGRTKGFHVAVIDDAGVAKLANPKDAAAAVSLLEGFRPRVVAVDGPATPALDGERSRMAERELVKAGVCGIRYTPDKQTLEAPHRTRYYDWILCGFELYDALRASAPCAGWEVIEAFPTASWCRWTERRPKGRTRAAWSKAALAAHKLDRVPQVTSQDVRDALGAALTARSYPEQTERFGEIVVPL